MRRKPDFIIVGAMKCATSTLHDVLAQQDGIFMSDPKEPNFFSDDEEYERGAPWYDGLFVSAGEDDLCGESSTHYTKLPTYLNTVERMHRYLPDVKLIYVIRHPIDRLVSQYIHEWSMRTISEPIDEAIQIHPRFAEYSRYAMQLRPYLDKYGPDNMMLVFFERLVAQPSVELNRVCQFIGYHQQPCWPQDESHQNASNRRLRNNLLRDAIVWNPVSTWFRRRFIPQAWRDTVKRLWQMKKRPQLGQSATQDLIAVFNDDLATLGNWLGIELTCDTFKSQAMNHSPTWQGELHTELT